MKKSITITVEEKQYEFLTREAEKESTTVSQLIRKYINKFMMEK